MEWETVGRSFQLTVEGGIFCIFLSLVRRGEWCLTFNDEILGYFPTSEDAKAEAIRRHA